MNQGKSFQNQNITNRKTEWIVYQVSSKNEKPKTNYLYCKEELVTLLKDKEHLQIHSLSLESSGRQNKKWRGTNFRLTMLVNITDVH